MPFDVVAAVVEAFSAFGAADAAAAEFVGPTIAELTAGMTSAEVATSVAAGELSAYSALQSGVTTLPELAAAGADATSLIQGGVTLDQLANAGFSTEQLASAAQATGQLTQATPYLEQAAAKAGGNTSLTNMISQDALSMKAQGLGADQIAQNLAQQYGIDQYAAANVAGMATGGSTAQQIAATLASDYGTQMTGLSQSGFGMGDIAKGLGYAKTGSQIAGGLAQIMQGQQARQAGKQIGALQADPYAQFRPQAAAQLQALLADPSTITSTPGYQFNLSQGMNQLQAKQAAQGTLVGGGALLQAQQFGQQYATSQLQQQQNLLATLSGANQAPAGASQAQAGNILGGAGASNYGLTGIASGLGQVINPLQTLYAQYNSGSPTPG
jgi:hypothetical protein